MTRASILALLAGLSFAASAMTVERADGGFRVGVRGLVYEIPSRGAPRLVEAGAPNAGLFSHNIRIVAASGMVAAYEDHRDDRDAVLEESSGRIVIRTDRSLGLDDYRNGGKRTPWDAARLVTDYVFRDDAPGVVAVSRLKALKPFVFRSWIAMSGPVFARYAVDGTELVPYPTKAEFKTHPSRYRTEAGSYLALESPDGRRWYLGREFVNFEPTGDTKPGRVYARCDRDGAKAEGCAVSPGEVISLSVSVGRLVADGDLDRMRALRTGDGRLPVVDFEGTWAGVPAQVRRGETKDYRPVAGLGWDGPSDLSFALRLAKDANGLCLRVEVTDDLVTNAFARADAGLGDSVTAVFASSDGKRTLRRVVSASEGARTSDGYLVELAVPWRELTAAGLSREKGIRLGLCVADQDRGTHYENWMGVSDGILGGEDATLFLFLDFTGVVPTFVPERPRLPDRAELAEKIGRIAAANAGLPAKTDDAYTSSLKAMTDYFLDFMRTDLDLGDTVKVDHRTRTVDASYRYYVNDRINKNADYLLLLQRELARRQEDLAAGRVRPVVPVAYPRDVRPEIVDGGFKVDGKELLLIGPDTWTNGREWHNDDIERIAAMGFNQLDVFYVGGKRREEIVRRAREAGLYCAWGSCTAHVTDDVTLPTDQWSATARARLDPKCDIGPYNAPTNQGPHFAYQISFGEQWNRKREATPAWAEEFRAHLRTKFGSLEKMNAAFGSSYADWSAIDFTECLRNDALKYESFVYRMEANLRRELPQQQWKARRFGGLPRSVHFSSSYNMTGLDPLVVLSDFEALWSIFDIVGFDSGFILSGGEWTFNFPCCGFDIDFARSCYPGKPVANNENHNVPDGAYLEYTNAETYLSNMLAFLLGQNASSVWNWAATRHTYGEYVFTRANTCHEMVRCALDLRTHPEEIGAFRHAPDPPFRILHSLPSMAERDPYMRSLYGLYGACSFTGWAVRYLTERHLVRDDFKGAKIVVVPDARRVSDRTFAALEGFSRKGGIVLVEGDAALTKDVWGKAVPSRQGTIGSFRRLPVADSRAQAAALNAALAEKGIRPPVRVTDADGRAPFGVIWRNARTAKGEEVVFLANLSKAPVTVNLPGRWTDVLGDGAILPRSFVLPPNGLKLGKASCGRQ